MIKACRLDNPEYSSTPDEILSGIGAASYNGRWNSLGHPIVYLGDSIAQVSMEILANVGKESRLLSTYSLLEVDIPEDCVLRVQTSRLSDNWNALNVMNCKLPDGWDAIETNPTSAQEFGDAWLKSLASLALVVPSVAVPNGANILLNPNHPDKVKLELGEIRPYQMDERIARQFGTVT